MLYPRNSTNMSSSLVWTTQALEIIQIVKLILETSRQLEYFFDFVLEARYNIPISDFSGRWGHFQYFAIKIR